MNGKVALDTNVAIEDCTRISLKKKGRPIPENDIWIAATCLEHRIPLVTSDSHFNWIEDLMVEMIS